MSGPVCIDCKTLKTSELQTLWWEFYSLQAFDNYILYLRLVYLTFYFVFMVTQNIELN